MIGEVSTLAHGLRVDRSSAGRVLVSGADARDLLQRIVTADVASLGPGQGTPSFLLERSGRIVDRVLIVNRERDYLLVGNPGRGEAIAEWVGKYVIADDVEVKDITAWTVQWTLLGAPSLRVLKETFALDAERMAPWEGRVLARGDGRLTVVRAEDLGGPTFHLMTPVAASAQLRSALQALPEGDADAYAAACLAGGLPRYGFEYDEKTIPLETGMLREISFDKGCYLGQEIIARLHHQKRVKRRLVRLHLEGAGLPARGDAVEAGGEPVGKITGAAAWEGEVLAFASVEAGADLDGATLAVRGADGLLLPATLREGGGA
ncbi:hypothetical protein K8I85_09595 [bacterium]|nr:hypothetical protein [bacterium]